MLDIPCLHRGRVIGQAECNLCSLRGTTFDLYNCVLHSVCSLGKRHTKVPACISCTDRKAPATPQPAPHDQL